MNLHWYPNTQTPPRGVQIVMRGPSGNVKPHDVRYTSGYYDNDYRPLNPWRQWDNSAITDASELLTEWCYRSELDAIS